MRATFFVLMLSLWPAGAIASIESDDPSRILQEQRQIREEAEAPRGKYSRFNEAARSRLFRTQEVIFSILEPGVALEDLPPPRQVQLMNAVEEVKAVLAANEGDRLECWRERRVGTMMMQTFCETVAKREELREQSKLWKDDVGVCARDGGCGGIR